jgi:cytochrome oxidase assembly protein ShyY1
VTFLLSRRWILFGVAVVLLAFLAYRLGEWQFSRLEDRVAANEVVRDNLAAGSVPVATLLSPGEPVSPRHEWRPVRATGRYVEDETVVVRYQTRDGQAGVDVVTPLRTGSGTAVLVNRGWLATGNVGSTRPDVPAAPHGQVTVVGWVRADATGDSARVQDRSTRAVSSRAIGPTLPFPVYGGFVELKSETPAPSEPLEKAEPPDLGEGPHFFYGLQWWFFAALALFGFCYLAWDEWRKARRSATAREASRRPREASRR